MKIAVSAFVGFLIGIASVVNAQGNAPKPPGLPGSPGAIFVPLPQCRVLSTVREAGQNAGHGSRSVDIRATRCGRIVPAYAVGFALKTVSYNRNAADHSSAGSGRTERPFTAPAEANGLLTVDVTPNEDLSVDVYGYFVAAGTPVSPMTLPVAEGGRVAATSVAATSATASRISGTGRVVAQDLHTGNRGEIYLDASVAPFNSTGVLMTANAGYPWLVARTATADSGSGFGVYNSANVAVMTARSDGAIQLMNGGFLDGRSDYFGSPGSYYGYVAIPTNIVHDVTLVDPHDSAGGATNRVIFYNAQSDAEYGSPNVTKYRAYTDGWDSHQHINFDSQIAFHWPGNQLYHFRAFSTFENKDTFWVRPATNVTYNSGTRADMFVSGNVGIGSPNMANWAELTAIEGPNTAIGFGAVTDFHVISNAYNDNGGWKYKTANPAANYYLYNGTHNWRVAGAGAAGSAITWLTAMTIDAAGRVGIGTAPAQKLSVGGFIESTTGGFKFPDQSIQATAYPFNGTSNSADLNRDVAGPLTSSVTNTNAAGSSTLAALAGNGTAFVRLASNEPTPTRDWRIGMTDGTGIFRIRNNASNTDMMTITGSAIHFNGDVDGTTIHATYQDLAEWVPAAEAMAAGTVVVVGEEGDNTVTASRHAYDTGVAGVVSPNPGLLLGVAGASKAKIATTGRVRVRVDATKAPIRKGDLLVTSDRPGMAMKSEPLDLGGVKIHRPGTLIGKALEPLADREGEILVLLSLQ